MGGVGGEVAMWSINHPVHNSQDLGNSPGVLLYICSKPRKNHLPTKKTRKYKNKYENSLLYIYTLYVNHQNIFFEHVDPYFQLLKKWGVLERFGNIQDGIIFCKHHNLKYIYEIDKNKDDSTIKNMQDDD